MFVRTTSPTSECTKITVSVDDIKNAMFTYDKKMHDISIVSYEKLLQFTGSKFGPSEQLSLEGGQVLVHGARQPVNVETQSQFDATNFTQKKTWEMQLKSSNIKSEKAMDNLSQLYLYLQNHCTLSLKSYIKSHLKHAIAKKIKDTVLLWMMIEKIYTSTSLINLVLQRTMKADLTHKNMYGESMELPKYFDVLSAQAKVALEAGVDYGSEAIIGLYQGALWEMDVFISKAPAWRNPLIKLDPKYTTKELWKIAKFDTFC